MKVAGQIFVRRVLAEPIVHAGLSPSLGGNINGPSLVRAPDWLAGAPARYLLYFAHHEGSHIRLALADDLTGPWRIHEGGVLNLRETPLAQEVPAGGWADADVPHLASPDVHVDDGARQLVMYYHGPTLSGHQESFRAVSRDGLRWRCDPGVAAANSYLRVFSHGGRRFGLAWGGEVLAERSDGSFARGPWPFPEGHRHAAVLVRGDTAHVFWTRIGDAPERILHSSIDLRPDWRGWQVAGTSEVLRPELPWEGGDLPVAPSRIGAAWTPENALRDPCFYEESGRLWLLYVGGGEQAIGLAEVTGL